MKTNLFVLFLIIFSLSSSIFSQFAFTFRYPEGDSSGYRVPKSKDGHHFLSRGRNSFHPGVDFNIAGTSYNEDEGEPVVAVAPGEVMEAYFQPKKWGNIILIKHVLPAPDSIVFSFYAHLKSILVAAGEIVSGGDTIGTVGRGPRNMYSAHLHFEMRKGNMADKPAGFFPAGRSMAWIKAHYYNPRAFLQSRSVFPSLAMRDDSDTETSEKIHHHKVRLGVGNIRLAKVQKVIPNTAAKFFNTESLLMISVKAESTVADQTSVWQDSAMIYSSVWRLKDREACRSNVFAFNQAVSRFFARLAIPSNWGSDSYLEQNKLDPAGKELAFVLPAS